MGKTPDRSSKRFEFTPDIAKFPSYAGLDLQNDPAAIAPNRFYKLQNARITGDQVVSRAGLQSVAHLSGTLLGIFDDLGGNVNVVDFNPKLWVGTGTSLDTYNASQSPTIQSAADANCAKSIGTRNGKAHFLNASAGDPALYSASKVASQSVVVTREVSMPGARGAGMDNQRALDLSGTLYFLAPTSSAGVGAMWSWNGSSLVQEFTFSDAGFAYGAKAFNNILNIGTDIYFVVVNQLYGRVAGVWGLVGTGGAVNLRDLCLYSGDFYAWDSNGTNKDIYKITTAGVFSLFHTIAASNMIDMTVFNGKIYYFARQGPGIGTLTIGEYGGAWNDTYALNPVAIPNDTLEVGPFGTNLFAMISGKLYSSSGTDLTSWTLIGDPATTSDNPPLISANQ